MTIIRAVKVAGKGALLENASMPKPSDYEFRIKVICAAVNPTDWMHSFYEIAPQGAIIGCDVSGIVDCIGDKVTSVKVGDKVSGFVHGSSNTIPEIGGFADYTILLEHIFSHIPEGISFEQAASWGIQVTTAGQGLYQALKIPFPNVINDDNINNNNETASNMDGKYILVWGGATSVGTTVIQFAKLSGLKPIAVCSPIHNDRIKSLGAVEVFDYHDATTPNKIKKLTNNDLQLAFDTISSSASVPAVAQSIGKNGGKVTMLHDFNTSNLRKDIKFYSTIAYSAFGRPVILGNTSIPASEEDKLYADKTWKLFEYLVTNGKYKCMPYEVLKNGLSAIPEAFARLQQGKVNGEKLVIRIADTP